ncbi:MAG: hypothetical protein GY862_36665 [Gammaproteobacteria bacterium]|nr:hypothetical protein [Gammaproteobacteria bacterium]
MKAKTLSLIAGAVLAANAGFVQAAELDETAGMPEIFGSMNGAAYQTMSKEEMKLIYGERLFLFGWKVVDRHREDRFDIKIGPCVKCAVDFIRDLF